MAKGTDSRSTQAGRFARIRTYIIQEAGTNLAVKNTPTAPPCLCSFHCDFPNHLLIFQIMCFVRGLLLFTLLPLSVMSQNPASDAELWLAKAPPVPTFDVPSSKHAWEK